MTDHHATVLPHLTPQGAQFSLNGMDLPLQPVEKAMERKLHKRAHYEGWERMFIPLRDRETLTFEFLKRLSTERHPLVRARMVAALAQFAKHGSGKALAGTVAALDDSDALVQLSAVNVMRQLRPLEVLPRLIQLMSLARPPWMRMAVIQTLAVYGQAAQSELPALRVQLGMETNQVIKRELQGLLDRLGQGESVSVPPTAPARDG